MGAQAFLLHCYVMEWTVDENKNVDPRLLEQLLGEHSEFFKILFMASPIRSRDNIINLIIGSSPIRKKII